MSDIFLIISALYLAQIYKFFVINEFPNDATRVSVIQGDGRF